MAPKESPLLQYIKDALMDKKYPNLTWFKKDEGIIFLNCPLKSKSEWNSSFENIYTDYGKLKTRKSSCDRQRFLQAMKVCPFIKLLTNKSSKEKKYYQFQEYCKSDGVTEEIYTILSTNEDVVMQTVQSTVENEMTTDGQCELMNNMNDVGIFSSQISADNNSFNETPIAFHHNEENQSDINELLNRVGVYDVDIPIIEDFSPKELADMNSASNVFANDEEINRAIDNIFCLNEVNTSQILEQEDMVCPDVAADSLAYQENGNNAISLYDESNNLLENFVGCNETPAISNSFNVGEEELSYSFIPHDYDPEKEFIESVLPIENKIVDSCSRNLNEDLDQVENTKVTPKLSEESGKCKVMGVYRLNENDPVVKHIQPTMPMFMMILRPEKS